MKVLGKCHLERCQIRGSSVKKKLAEEKYFLASILERSPCEA
jgi:hypothetical protein